MIDAVFLSKCTDAQINMGVAWLEARRGLIFKCKKMIGIRKIINTNCYQFYPCSEVNDAWPIMMSNSIAIDWLSNGDAISLSHNWSKSGIESTNSNPLRAAMEVYILMKKGK